jgi:uncharacterized membrane protein YecN with MAPEG domain
MVNNSQNQEEYERQMAQRRKNNRIMLLVIGAVLLIALAFSQVPYAWVYVLGTLIVVGGLLYARSIVERRYKSAAARERLKQAQQDDPKE